MIVNVIVTQHHRQPSMQISHKPVILGHIVDGFGSFWPFFWWFWIILASIVIGFGWLRVLAENRLFAQVHALQTKAMKQQILGELASPTSKVRVRLGVDIPSIRNVTVCEYFQETG